MGNAGELKRVKRNESRSKRKSMIFESAGVIPSETSFLKERPTPWYASLSRRRFY